MSVAKAKFLTHNFYCISIKSTPFRNMGEVLFNECTLVLCFSPSDLPLLEITSPPYFRDQERIKQSLLRILRGFIWGYETDVVIGSV